MKKILLSVLVTCTLKVAAQQEVMVSQYMFNGLFLNPAYAGSHQYVSSSLLHRSQWVSFPGAPTTLLFAVDGPVLGRNVGLGLIVAHDRIGVTDQTDIYGNYAYQLKLKKGKLAFGLKGGVSNYLYRNNDLIVWDDGDNEFNGRTNVWIPKFSCGTYYFSDKWFAGLAIPNLIAYDPDHAFSADVSKASSLRRHVIANAGYVITLNETFKLKPSALVKYVPTAPLQIDINVNLLYRDQVWLGGSYRSGDAFTLMAEYQTNLRFRVGYAYDFTTTKIRKYSNGTHEIMIGFDFGRDITKVKTPRYF